MIAPAHGPHGSTRGNALPLSRMPRMKIEIGPPHVRTLIRDLLKSGLSAGDPADAVRRAVRRRGWRLDVGTVSYDLRRYGRILAVGAGKASAAMAAELERILGEWLHGGLLTIPRGQAAAVRRVEVTRAGHPLPDEAGHRAARRLLTLAGTLTARDLMFVLLSGGASSLLPAPSSPVTLADKRRTTQQLLASGATIQEINTVRKHLSLLKGGRLAAATPARIVSLILSDVVGQDLGTIASGPTAADPTTYRDAQAVLRRYGLWDRGPARVRDRLTQGLRGMAEETPKPDSPVFRRVQNEIIGNNAAAVASVANAAADLGLHPLVLSTSLTGEAREAAKLFGAMAREIHQSGRPVRRPACLIAGGELTVTVHGDGRGGRAQEFALAAALEIAGLPDTWIVGFGTDGVDGPTNAAGAVVNGLTVRRATRLGIDARAALQRNDAYPFFKKAGGHISTGPTGTNINDLYLLIAT